MSKLGLVGYNCAHGGIGELNRQIAHYMDLDGWLAKPHKVHGTGRGSRITTVCKENDAQTLRRFVSKMDTILFVESPFYRGLPNLAHSLGKRLVCVPMMEWLQPARRSWTPRVDLYICPTKQCYDALKKDRLNCVYFPWPVDADKFPYRQRPRCEQFVFINAGGGWHGRKGASVMLAAKKLWPEMPLLVYSKKAYDWPAGTVLMPAPAKNTDLYGVGDVLIAPHTVDGLGLEPMEAMSSGLPVITTDGAPWNENPAIARIPSTTTRKSVGRLVDWHACDPKALVAICKKLLNTDISQESRAARDWAESLSWPKHIAAFNSLVRKGP